jgi:putative heme-binding domain-containing protein
MRIPLVTLALALGALHAAAADWKPLFNGRNLEGWSGDPRLWKVENGVIRGETDAQARKINANTFLIWQGGEPQDFELEYSARVTGNNSGVQYRSRVVDSATWAVGGYQMDLHPDQSYLAMLYEERGRGIACQRGQKVRLGETPAVTGKMEVPAVDLSAWNRYRIVVRGHTLQHFVNDTQALEVIDEHPAKRALKGVIALQLHAGAPMTAEFKDLRIRELAVNPTAPASASTPAPAVSWIWNKAGPEQAQRVWFRKDFDAPRDLVAATLTITCDNRHQAKLNGKDLGASADWNQPRHVDVLAALRLGERNALAIEGSNDGGPAGLAARLEGTRADGSRFFVVSDSSWTCSTGPTPSWADPAQPPSGQQVTVLATMGDEPWGMVIAAPDPATGVAEDMTATCKVAPGFKLERVYRVPPSQGSWVGMTVDGEGKLLCCDQYGEIHRVTLPENPALPARTTPLGISLRGAHGLLWHEGVLWVCVNEANGAGGVWRVTDTNSDGVPDRPEKIKALQGSGEHGPHSLVAAPDGKSIYLVAGNHTDLAEMDRSLVPRVWAEDQLLPRRPDARGHARERMAPGGWIARFLPDGTQWELFSIGYRNSFDLAFNEHGDPFTYDSDMEWDLGMPWYRPTRICHAIAGSEFGWRNGTGKWPAEYEDSMPSQLDIGPGSPTGMVSGKGARFPARYQRALYALDWTFATIRAIHLTPDGRGYRAESEELVAGKGLPLTDAVIGRDGAMYFLTGGRRTGSALWRVSYHGSEPTDPVPFQSKPLGLLEPAAARTALGSADRIARFEARTALEHQGPAVFRELLTASNPSPWERIHAAIGLARTGTADDVAPLVKALRTLDWKTLDTAQRVNWLRAAGLAFTRHGQPAPAVRQQVLDAIDASFPSRDLLLDRELCRMLAYLQAPGIVARALDLMDSQVPPPPPDWLTIAKRNSDYGRTIERMITNLPPAEVIHHVYCLRCVSGPWRGDERQRFFQWINRLTSSQGGMSYAGFIEDLRKQTLETCTPEEREQIAKLGTHTPPNPFANLPPVKGPGREWTVDEVTRLASGTLKGRDPQRGHDAFRGALCAACHRVGNEGGAAGPDLSNLGARFSPRDLAEAIVDPSKVVSDQYAFDRITRNDGSVVTGKILEEAAGLLKVATNPFDLSQSIEIPRADVRATDRSPASPMPPGMINRLNEEELKDLLAWLLGAG